MAEPVPDSIQAQDGAAAPDSSATLPRNAEDRAAAAALSSLNTAQIDTADDVEEGAAAGAGAVGGAGGGATRGPLSKADQEALGKAMSRLEMMAGKAKSGAGAGAGAGAVEKKKEAEAVGGVKGVDEVKKKQPPVKVAAEDVNLLVDQLDLSKPKATELLKAHEGNPAKAIRAFIVPPTA
ncbi:hypothetical protein VTO42DRAFT_1266 [Malbranchea cinnamomea]